MIEKHIQTQHGIFCVSYDPQQVEAVNKWSGDISGNQFRFKYIVFVEIGGKGIDFDFFGSIADYQQSKELGAKGLPFALYCFLSDAAAGMMPFEEFSSEFGYTDEKEAKRVWKGCKEATRKARKIGLTDAAIYDTLNELSQRDDC